MHLTPSRPDQLTIGLAVAWLAFFAYRNRHGKGVFLVAHRSCGVMGG